MKIIRTFGPTIFVFILGMGIGVGGLLFTQYIKGPKQTVSVTGQGVVEATADQAVVNVHIENTSWNQETAQDATKKDTLALKNTLRKLGVPESRITENAYDNGFGDPAPMSLEVNSMPSSQIAYPIRKPSEYSSSSDLSITLSSIAGIDKILNAINAQKNAKVTYTDYSLKSTVKYEESAREKALQNARSQVESIAKINKVSVGKLVSITDSNYAIGLMSNTREMMAPEGAIGQPQITYGEKTIPVSASFRAVYELY